MTIDQQALTASLRRLAGQEVQDNGVVPALTELIEACVDLFGVTGSGIMLADEQNITRYVTATSGPGRALETAESETGEGPCTEAFVENHIVANTDLATATKWPALAKAIEPYNIHAVLGVPVRMGAITVGSLDVYYDRPHEWEPAERAALGRYADVIESTVTAALAAHNAGELAGQLQYALDYRVIIERGVGYLMARDRVDALAAFNRLRRAARGSRRKIGDIAEELLTTGSLPVPDGR
jgi:GAF domain-containing protein